MTPTEALDHLMAYAADHARRFVPTVEQIAPIACLMGRDGTTTVVGLDPTEGASAANEAALRRVCDDTAVAVTVVREAWLGRGPVDDPDVLRAVRGELRVRDLPPAKRVDALLVYGEAVGRVRRLATYVITGTHPGRALAAQPESVGEGGQVVARWYPLLRLNVISERATARYRSERN